MDKNALAMSAREVEDEDRALTCGARVSVREEKNRKEEGAVGAGPVLLRCARGKNGLGPVWLGRLGWLRPSSFFLTKIFSSFFLKANEFKLVSKFL